MDWVQQGAKLCVGLVQDWVTLELAIRIHITKSEVKFSATHRNKLRAIFNIVFAVLLLGFIAWTAAVIISAHQPDN